MMRSTVAAVACGMLLCPAFAHAQLAGARLTQLEERLLAAPAFSLQFSIIAEGAFEARLQGTLHVEGDQVELASAGEFGGEAVQLRLAADGAVMEGGNAGRSFREAQPAALREALLLGLTRMGLLHNLARLTAAAAPDHASGGVADWVQPRSIWADTTPAQPTLRFEIHVAGTHAGSATVQLDPASGLPRERRQVVHFPGGSMTVTEQYEFTSFAPVKQAEAHVRTDAPDQPQPGVGNRTHSPRP